MSQGRTVRTLASGHQRAGSYSVTWDSRDNRGRQVPRGVYFYRLDTPGFRSVKKAVEGNRRYGLGASTSKTSFRILARTLGSRPRAMGSVVAKSTRTGQQPVPAWLRESDLI